MTCCDTPGLKPISEAMEIMRSKISALTEIEMVSLYQSLDRVLAEDVVSPMDIPPHANS
ncbi:MAG: molybdopterin molybdenumtransferase MoeA, partial [Gammaproteobacteria bacterium CG22_combo_CG10-13_8_21_14_all_40_8]